MPKFMTLAAAIICISSTSAFAVSEAVKNACDSDYVAYCSQHKIGSTALRACMKSHRHMLMSSCLKAISKSGEASADEVKQYKREKAGG